MGRAKKNRIAIVGPSTRFLSGISYYTALLANALSKNADVSVLLFRHMLPKRLFPGHSRIGRDLTSISYHPDIHVHEILDWFNPGTWIAGYKEMLNSDIIIIEWWTSSVAHIYLALVLLLKRKRPILMEFHEVVDPLEYGVLPLRIYAIITGRIIRKHADAFVVHSTEDKNLISEQYGIAYDTIHIVPVGLFNQYPVIEKTRARTCINVSEPHILLFFGLIRPYKGVSCLIDAFEAIPPLLRIKMRLFIIGEAWEDQTSCLRALQSPTASQITLIDRYMSDDEIPYYFSSADILILPYLRASQSGVAHIGISYGLPIIASEVGGLKDSLSRYEGTTFVRPGSSDDITEAILSVTTNEKRRYPIPDTMQWEDIRGKWEEVIKAIPGF